MIYFPILSQLAAEVILTAEPEQYFLNFSLQN